MSDTALSSAKSNDRTVHFPRGRTLSTYVLIATSVLCMGGALASAQPQSLQQSAQQNAQQNAQQSAQQNAQRTGMGLQGSASNPSPLATSAANTSASVNQAPDGGASKIPELTEAVAPNTLLGVGLPPHHYDDNGYPESAEGLLIIELDPMAGPITMVLGTQPHYLEAQFINTQRDGIWMARRDDITDVLPSGVSHTIPYGYGAIKRTLAAITLVEAQTLPHLSDNQKSYEPFPLRDLYLGGTLSLSGVRGEVRYVDRERYVGFGQFGLNLAAMAGARFNRTFGAFAIPVVLGGGIRYPAVINIIGSHWTSGAELTLGFGAADDDKDTANAIALPGIFHEVEWTFDRDVNVTDYRADARPYNYGVHSFFVKVGAYADFFGGAINGLLFDIHLGYRFNLIGPTVPQHEFKETKVTYASERYVQRKLEEETRRQQLEALRNTRNAPSLSYPAQ